MEDSVLIYNARCLHPGVNVVEGYVRFSEGRIAAVGEGAPPEPCSGIRIDGEGALLTPGFIDVHTHGMHAFNFDRGADELRAAAACLGRYGVTTVVPTLVPRIDSAFMQILEDVSAAMDAIDSVDIPGLHLEGPFVAIAGAACDTREGDLALLQELLAACGNRVAVMSIAPEVPGIVPIIEALVAAGIVPFITHTRASVDQCLAAIDAGARHATHFYDVFPVPEETDPGVRPVGAVETILGDPRATCDFICDGIHVHPMAIRAALAAKGWRGVSLITDASFGAGLGPGTYETPWGYPVELKPGNAPRIANPHHDFHGALAGSALTMNQGMENLRGWLDLPEAQAWALGTCNPARVLGLNDRGQLQPGMRADLVLWKAQEKLEPRYTWAGGQLTHDGV